ncbi:hypothetical protein AVEN_222817-1, partial [Araneus ventricosus]
LVFGIHIGYQIWAEWGVTPHLPLELLQQSLSFAGSIGIVLQEDDTITQYASAFASEDFTVAQ